MSGSIFEQKVLRPIQEARAGNPIQIPFGLDRMNEVISLRKSIYTCVAGNPGSGKTSFVDDNYILKPYVMWQQMRDTTDVSFAGLYRSMERNVSLKLTKWACWRLYYTDGIMLDSDTLLGYKKGRVDDATWDKVVGCRDWADEMLDYVDIRDGRTTPDQHNNWVYEHALRNGTLFIADSKGVFEANNPASYISLFSGDKLRTLRNGKTELYTEYSFQGDTKQIKQGERVYYPIKPKEITVIVADHVGKFSAQANTPTVKSKIDLHSSYASDHRDIFGYSPVDVAQLGRAISDIQRVKHADGDLSPQLDDIKDTGNITENVDMVISLFNPFRFHSYDDKGMYKGYNIRDLMVNPGGYNRYRLISILKNNYGIDDVDYGMKFLGEVSTFMTLPKPEDPRLQQVYTDIANGY